jgi:hypothetical protein
MPQLFTSKNAYARMEEIDRLCKAQKMNTLQIASEMGISKSNAHHFLKHMERQGWLTAHKLKVIRYSSTNTFKLPAFNKKIAMPLVSEVARSSPEVRPFRDKWDTLMYGEPTLVAQSNHQWVNRSIVSTELIR